MPSLAKPLTRNYKYWPCPFPSVHLQTQEIISEYAFLSLAHPDGSPLAVDFRDRVTITQIRGSTK